MSGEEPIVRNAVRCGVCGAGADRYSYGFVCQANKNHVGDLVVGIFSDMSIKPIMTFDTFCDERKIRGNFIEALFRYIMAKAEDPNKLTEEDLATYWGEQLGNAIVEMANLMYQNNTKANFYRGLRTALNNGGGD